MHTNYDSRNINYDVALLILERAAELGPTVQTVCLPSPRQTFDGMLCVSSGWGKNSFGGKYQQVGCVCMGRERERDGENERERERD